MEVGYERAFEGQGSLYGPEQKIRPFSGRPGSYLMKAWRKKGGRGRKGVSLISGRLKFACLGGNPPMPPSLSPTCCSCPLSLVPRIPEPREGWRMSSQQHFPDHSAGGDFNEHPSWVGRGDLQGRRMSGAIIALPPALLWLVGWFCGSFERRRGNPKPKRSGGFAECLFRTGAA